MRLGHHFQYQKVKGQLAGGGEHIMAASRTTCYYYFYTLGSKDPER